MRIITQWLETAIDSVNSGNQYFSRILLILLVLVLGAGSLYMLIHTPA